MQRAPDEEDVCFRHQSNGPWRAQSGQHLRLPTSGIPVHACLLGLGPPLSVLRKELDAGLSLAGHTVSVSC